MKKRLLTLLLFITHQSFSQHTFERIYGTGGGSFVTGSGNGYIVGGSSGPAGLLLKVDQDGDTIWVQDTYSNIPNAVRHTFDDGYVFVSSFFDTTFVTKTDDLGHVNWITTIYDTSSNNYSRTGINLWQIEDSSYTVGLQEVRFMQNIPYIITSVDKNGTWIFNEHEIQVTNSIGNISSSKIQRLSDKGYGMTGDITSTGLGVVVTDVGRLDSAGALGFLSSFGDQTMTYDMNVSAISETPGAGFFIGGASDYFTGTNAMYILRIDWAGDSLWSKTFGPGVVSDLVCTSDTGCVIVCDSASTGVITMMKINSTGNVMWTRKFSGLGTAVASHIETTSDGGFIIVGQTGPRIYLIKTDANGLILPPAGLTTSGPTLTCPGDTIVITAAAGYSYLWNNFAMTQSISVFAPGDYYAAIMDSNSVIAYSDTIHLTNYATTMPVITQQLPALTLSSTAGIHYEWYDNGVAIANTDSINFTPVHGGNYSVLVTDSNGCMTMSNSFPYIHPGINELGNIRSLIIRNSNGVLEVNTMNANEKIVIYNIKGQQMMNVNSIAGSTKMDISSFVNGIYVVQTTDGAGIVRHERFVK